MELLLPVAIKLFPGMLPSTFQTATEKVSDEFQLICMTVLQTVTLNLCNHISFNVLTYMISNFRIKK
jgi:hypothetical protein